MFIRLRVWQISMELVEDVYRVTSTFPDIEKFALTSQINRCAVSIPSNIAEGKGRNSGREFKQFLYIARGSLFELRTQLILAQRLGYLGKDENLKMKIAEVQSMLNGLINKL
jgi:four helix bundle protein